MKPGAINHPKIEDLAERLNIRLREARGIVEALIHFTNQYAERGDVGRFTNAQIAKRLDWGGEDEEPERLIAALDDAGWIDPHPVHRFIVHHWPDHAPDYTKRKMKGTEGNPGPGWAVDDVVIDPQKEDSRNPQNIPDPLSSPILSSPILTSPILSNPPLDKDPAADAAPPTQKAKKAPPAEWSLSCSDLLIELLEPVPGARIPKGARASWAREMEKLVSECPELRQNGTDPAVHIEGAIRWALGPQNLGQEYEVVVRSGRALREKWPKLRAAARRVESKRVPTQAEFHEQVMAKVKERIHGAS